MRQDISGVSDAVHLSALGVPVVVRASGGRSSELAQAVETAWERCLTGSPDQHSEPASVVVEAFLDKEDEAVRQASGRGTVASTSLSELMHELTPAVTTAAITARAASLLMLHACVLADPSSGAAVVLVGPSGAGKTTLARTLGTSFGYVTDECAGICDDHTVVPFPKPLSVLGEDLAGLKEQVSPEALGLLDPPGHLRVAAVLFLDRGTDARATPTLEAVPNVHALGMLCPQVSFVGSRPAPLQRIVALLDAVGGLRRVSYREAADLRPLVEQLVGEAS